MVQTINLSDNDIKKALLIMMAEANIESMAVLSRSLGIKATTFRSAISNNSIRLVDFIKASELMGYEIKLEKKE